MRLTFAVILLVGTCSVEVPSADPFIKKTKREKVLSGVLERAHDVVSSHSGHEIIIANNLVDGLSICSTDCAAIIDGDVVFNRNCLIKTLDNSAILTLPQSSSESILVNHLDGTVNSLFYDKAVTLPKFGHILWVFPKELATLRLVMNEEINENLLLYEIVNKSIDRGGRWKMVGNPHANSIKICNDDDLRRARQEFKVRDICLT